MSIAALMLSIPGSVLATLEVVDRLIKRRRAKALIDTVSPSASVMSAALRSRH